MLYEVVSLHAGTKDEVLKVLEAGIQWFKTQPEHATCFTERYYNWLDDNGTLKPVIWANLGQMIKRKKLPIY